jgi:hypothetical protein
MFCIVRCQSFLCTQCAMIQEFLCVDSCLCQLFSRYFYRIQNSTFLLCSFRLVLNARPVLPLSAPCMRNLHKLSYTERQHYPTQMKGNNRNATGVTDALLLNGCTRKVLHKVERNCNETRKSIVTWAWGVGKRLLATVYTLSFPATLWA